MTAATPLPAVPDRCPSCNGLVALTTDRAHDRSAFACAGAPLAGRRPCGWSAPFGSAGDGDAVFDAVLACLRGLRAHLTDVAVAAGDRAA